MSYWKSFVDGLASHPKPERVDPIRLVCFDLDGVLTQQDSSWVAVHDHFGVSNEECLGQFLRGEIDETQFIRKDVELWHAKHQDFGLPHLEQILSQRITTTAGAQETIRELRARDVHTCIVSGGIETAALTVARRLGIEHVSANRLLADDRGRLTGESVIGTPLRDKTTPVQRFARRLGVPLGQVASVGNSSPDIMMFRTSGLGIAFRPTDTFVQEAADVVLPGRDLREILGPIFGQP